MATANVNGAWGERKAAAFLRKKGLRVVERNFSCRFGEIDIIAENKDFLIFCEVKLRKSDAFGAPREFVTAQKQQRLRKTAALYLSQYPTEKQPRFDVVEVYAEQGIFTAKPVINHLEDVF